MGCNTGGGSGDGPQDVAGDFDGALLGERSVRFFGDAWEDIELKRAKCHEDGAAGPSVPMAER